ncbi:hypothetical protein SCHPADRAFT_891694 [Schizopora paradoxa]|uniref:Uncharacterized protein n=1 Tax=Schizopora paradoxa TaxID=27342 RepID=A0A0H2RI11_9AGAM|nr:hypothetical protein SCHPADRAFT_891694 [Schizopora paradoxa]
MAGPRSIWWEEMSVRCRLREDHTAGGRHMRASMGFKTYLGMSVSAAASRVEERYCRCSYVLTTRNSNLGYAQWCGEGMIRSLFDGRTFAEIEAHKEPQMGSSTSETKAEETGMICVGESSVADGERCKSRSKRRREVGEKDEKGRELGGRENADAKGADAARRRRAMSDQLERLGSLGVTLMFFHAFPCTGLISSSTPFDDTSLGWLDDVGEWINELHLTGAGPESDLQWDSWEDVTGNLDGGERQYEAKCDGIRRYLVLYGRVDTAPGLYLAASRRTARRGFRSLSARRRLRKINYLVRTALCLGLENTRVLVISGAISTCGEMICASASERVGVERACGGRDSELGEIGAIFLQIVRNGQPPRA